MRLPSLLLGFTLLAAGCAGGEGGNDTALNEVAANNAAATDENASAPAAEDAIVERKDEALEFSYSWPAAAVAIAPLNAWLEKHAEDQYAQAHGPAADYLKETKGTEIPFRTYDFQQKWQVVADTPAILVMEAEGYEYTGGAHGMPFYASLIWDREAGKRLPTDDVIDIVKLSRLARDSFCEQLDKERAKKRGGPIEKSPPTSISEFNECVEMAEQQIVPISKGGSALDAIRVIIAPYSAGPYAEGTYEIELPVNDKLMAAVKPDYRGWFAPVGTP